MTNLVYAYNQIPYEAKTVAKSFTENRLFPWFNILGNKKSEFVDLSSTSGTWNLVFDLGKDSSATDITKSAEYILITNYKALLPSAGTIYLEYYSGSYTTATSFTDTDVTAALTGFNGRDFIKTFASTSAYNLWRVRCSIASDAIGKIYFGTFLDLGTEPDDIQIKPVSKQAYFISDSGTNKYIRTGRDTSFYNIRYNAISKTKIAELEQIINAREKEPLMFMHLKTVTDILNGGNNLAVNLIDYKVKYIRSDLANLELTFKDSL